MEITHEKNDNKYLIYYEIINYRKIFHKFESLDNKKRKKNVTFISDKYER